MDKQYKACPLNERKVFKNLKNSKENKFNTNDIQAKIKKYLPENYNFEIIKILNRIDELNSKRICLQFPEGLLIFSTVISDLIKEFTGCDSIIMGDVTYGGCCIDDYVASLNDCDLIVHFAHSCLIPITEMIKGIKLLYIFVDIKFDIWHCIETFKKNFTIQNDKRLFALASSIQFVSSVHYIANDLKQLGYNVLIPQAKPLSPGEILGCTSPRLSKDVDAVFFICDGRFHLESLMIANPLIKKFYKYNPYNKQLTEEEYDFNLMIKNREIAIKASINMFKKKETNIGFILGTLGHQGSLKVLENLKTKLLLKNVDASFINILIPEINASTLNSFEDTIDFWLQISCPRLSIDWSLDVIKKPLLTPFEFNVVLENKFDDFYNYPMDFYSHNSLGNWTPNHKCNDSCKCSS